MDSKEKKAKAVVRKIFNGYAGTIISRDDILYKRGVALKTFQNNSAAMENYGLVKYERDTGQGRKILSVEITEKGKEALNELPKRGGKMDANDSMLTDLNALGAFVRKFNSRNEFWELELKQKRGGYHS